MIQKTNVFGLLGGMMATGEAPVWAAPIQTQIRELAQQSELEVTECRQFSKKVEEILDQWDFEEQVLPDLEVIRGAVDLLESYPDPQPSYLRTLYLMNDSGGKKLSEIEKARAMEESMSVRYCSSLSFYSLARWTLGQLKRVREPITLRYRVAVAIRNFLSRSTQGPSLLMQSMIMTSLVRMELDNGLLQMAPEQWEELDAIESSLRGIRDRVRAYDRNGENSVKKTAQLSALWLDAIQEIKDCDSIKVRLGRLLQRSQGPIRPTAVAARRHG